MSKTILWVEDDYELIQPVVYPLVKAGYHIVNYPNTKVALDNLEQLRNADLILLDLFLPSGTGGPDFGTYPGVQFLRELRKTHGIETTVVVFTVLSQKELVAELYELGAADVIRKPIRPSRLKERIEEAIQKAK